MAARPSPRRTFPSDQPFSFSMWVKVDSRGDSGWSTRPAMPLLTKGINGAAMQSTFSLSSDYYEYEFYLESGTGRPVFRMYNMGLSTEYVDIQASGSVPLDTWTFLSVEFIGNDNPDHPEVVNLRINGVLDPSHTLTTSASFTTWSGMQQTSAPLLIGNSGEDSASISSGDWFDGNIIHVASWIAALSTAGDPHNADTFSALKTGQQDGAPATTEDAPYLQNSTCLSLDSTSIDGVSCCAIGHPDGLTSIKCENSKYVSSLTHAFTDSFDSGDWDIGTTVSDLDVISFTSTITGQGWVVGDSITVGTSTGVITAVSNYSVTTATDITASTGTTAATVTRSVKAVVADGKDLYYTHSLGRVAKESSDWYGAGGSEIDALSATSGVVAVSEPGDINNIAILNEDLYLSAEVGVYYVASNIFEVEDQGAELRYSTSSGGGRYTVLNGDQDGGTCVGVDPETGHLLVANTGTTESSVTEIDVSIHQAFQHFDSNSTPAVTAPVTTLATYRNVNGPPDVEVS